jgi:hypothetical protein
VSEAKGESRASGGDLRRTLFLNMGMMGLEELLCWITELDIFDSIRWAFKGVC